MSFIEQIDNSPVFKLLESIIFEGPKYIAGAIVKGASALGEAFSGSGGNTLSDGGSFSLGSWFGGRGGDDIARAPERVQEAGVSIQGPAQQQSVHHVDMADIGQLSAPTFSVVAPSQSQGAGMNV